MSQLGEKNLLNSDHLQIIRARRVQNFSDLTITSVDTELVGVAVQLEFLWLYGAIDRMSGDQDIRSLILFIRETLTRELSKRKFQIKSPIIVFPTSQCIGCYNL